MKRISLALLVLSAGLWLGCGRSTTVTGPEGEDVTVTQEGDGTTITVKGPNGQKDVTFTQTGDGGQVNATIQGDDGKTVHVLTNEQGVKLPDDFPADVPVYPGGTVVNCTTSEDLLQLMVQTTDSLQQAKTFYLGKLKDLGWADTESMDMGQVMSIAASKGQRKIAIMITPADATHVMIALKVETQKE